MTLPRWPSGVGLLACWLIVAAAASGVAAADPAQPPAGQAAQCPDHLSEEIPVASNAEDRAWREDGQLRGSGDDPCSAPYPFQRMPHQPWERARPEYPGTLVLKTESIEEMQEYCKALARSTPEVALSDPICMMWNDDIVTVPVGALPQHAGLDLESLVESLPESFVSPDAEGWDFLRRWRHVPPCATQRDGQSSRSPLTD